MLRQRRYERRNACVLRQSPPRACRTFAVHYAAAARVTPHWQVGFERSATRDDVRVTLSVETLEEMRDAGSVTRVNSNCHVSKVCLCCCIAVIVCCRRRHWHFLV